jgi:hypothetical protein
MFAPAVAVDLGELRRAYGAANVTATEDGLGGALVIIDHVPLGPPYVQAETWAGFHITHLHPSADIYPIHVRGDLARIDHAPLGAATSTASFQGRPSIQLSRKSNRRDPATFDASLKLEKVMTWLRAK